MNIVPFPQTVTHEGTTFYLRTSAVVPGTPAALRIATDRPLTDDEVARFAQIVGYVYQTRIRPLDREASLPEPVRDTDRSLVMSINAANSARSNLAIGLAEFEDELSQMVVEGTPVRKSDRAGAGTRGTRLVDGFGPIGFVLYWDNVLPVNQAA